MKFVPIIINPEEDRDNHLVEHAREIAAGLPCECARVDTTESGLVVVTEPDPMTEVGFDPNEELKALFGLDPNQTQQQEDDKDGYDPGGPYL